MKITDSLYVLPISANLGGAPNVLNHSLILDNRQGPTLVDAGGSIEALEIALAEANVKLAELRRLILTHQDPDHIASAAALVRASGATVLAHAAEAPYIDGTRKWLKMPPVAVLETLPPQIADKGFPRARPRAGEGGRAVAGRGGPRPRGRRAGGRHAGTHPRSHQPVFGERPNPDCWGCRHRRGRSGTRAIGYSHPGYARSSALNSQTRRAGHLNTRGLSRRGGAGQCAIAISAVGPSLIC